MTMEMNKTVEAVRALTPGIGARSDEIETATAAAARSRGEADDGRLFRHARAVESRWRRARPGDADASDRGAGTRRRFGRVGRHDRFPRAGAVREAAARGVRRVVCRGPRCHSRRRLQPDWSRNPGRRRVPGHRPVVVRERLPALPLVHRPLLRRRRPHAAGAHDGAAPRPGRHQGHLVGVRSVWHR